MCESIIFLTAFKRAVYNNYNGNQASVSTTKHLPHTPLPSPAACHLLHPLSTPSFPTPHLLPHIHRLTPTASHPLPHTHCLTPTASHPLPHTYCLTPTASHPLHHTHCLTLPAPPPCSYRVEESVFNALCITLTLRHLEQVFLS